LLKPEFEDATSSMSDELLKHRLKLSKTQLVLKGSNKVQDELHHSILQDANQLLSGRPLAYILGATEFCGLEIMVNDSVLIPRPETEELVEWIVSKHAKAPIRILDIGTGSGCIALALKSQLAGTITIGIDVSEEAISIARKNADLLNLEVEFLVADINDFEPKTAHKFDLIVSNPPYIAPSEQLDQSVANFEPKLALFSPTEDPLYFYDLIVARCESLLETNGTVYFELSEFHAQKTAAVLSKHGFQDVVIRSDLQGKWRMLRASRKVD